MIAFAEESGGAPKETIDLVKEMEEMFSATGKLSSSPDFEYRAEQQQMAIAVAEALDGCHVLCAEAGRIHSRDDRCPCRRADRCRGPCVEVEQSPGGQTVEMRRRGIAIAVGAEMGPVVLARDPEDVRSGFRCCTRRG